MSTESFSRFSDLPEELKLQILKHAASKSAPASTYALLCMVRQQRPFWRTKKARKTLTPVVMLFIVPFEFADSPFRTRMCLMATSSLARLVALGAWREEIAVEPVGKSPQLWHARDVLLEWLDRQIVCVGGKMRNGGASQESALLWTESNSRIFKAEFASR